MSRVAFLLPDFRIGGAERVALSLIEAFVERGIEVDLVLLEAEGELLPLLPHAVNVVSLDAARIRYAVRPLADYLRERRPDAVQVSMWPLTLVPLIARRLAGTTPRVVTSDHTMLSESFPDRGLLHRRFLRLTIRLGYPLADARIAVSEGVARDLVQIGGLDRDSITVVANPVFDVAPAIDAPQPDWGGQGARVLTVGSLKREKNQALLIDAFARLVSDMEARLIIVGEGQARPQLEQQLNAAGLADRISLPGATLDPGYYYRSADLFVLSSDNEGYPLVLVEAMLHGLRIVSTNCKSGPNEMLDEGRYGRLVPTGDAAALATAMHDALTAPHDPQAVRQRAIALSAGAIDRYEALLLPVRWQGSGKVDRKGK